MDSEAPHRQCNIRDRLTAIQASENTNILTCGRMCEDRKSMIRDRADWLAFVFCLLFVCLGCLWVGEMGIQNDEALFSAGIYPPSFDWAMVMTYVGTLKSFLYMPIFRVWRPSAASTRIPVVILGALTIWLFYLLSRRTIGPRAAVAGVALLATDSTFLMTTRYDWGPVVLQHLCLVGGVLSVLRFVETLHHKWLGLGFFVFGLGMWDKALFVWSLVGLSAAVLIVFPRRLFPFLRLKEIGLAVLSFTAGACPLLIYNVNHEWVTFRSNAAWSSEEIGYKARLLLSTMQGNSILGTLPGRNGMGRSGSRIRSQNAPGWAQTSSSGSRERTGRSIC